MNYVDLKKSKGRERTSTIAYPRKNAKKSRAVTYVMAIAVTLGLLFFATIKAGPLFAKISSPTTLVSTVAKVQKNKLKETDGRTNILILGYDQRENGVILTQLTDTLLVASVDKNGEKASLISIPRDLWVKRSDDTYSKINEVYAYKGAEELSFVVGNVTGIPIHYYLLVNFGMFKNVINTLGGVRVNIEKSFTDFEYPVEGMENATCGKSDEDAQKMLEDGASYSQIYPCRYEAVNFPQGTQILDGDTALKYVRSRHGDSGEGTDFARAKRQQNLIMAVKSGILSKETLFDITKINELYKIYEKQVDSNFDMSTIELFLNLANNSPTMDVRNIVLDDRSEEEAGGLLYAPTDTTLYGGRYVLIPKTGDYSQIHAYINKLLFN